MTAKQFLARPLCALTLAIAALAAPVHAADLTLKPVWTTGDLAIPESALVSQDGSRDVIYVSLIDGKPDEADGKGAIARLDSDGNLLDAAFVSGLDAPKGMGEFEGKLYVSDIKRLHVIDIKNRRIEKTYTVDDAIFLNDITVDGQGRVYVSDSRANRVYRLADDKVSVYLDNIENANGVLAEGDDLWVTSALRLLKVDAKKNISVVADEGFVANLDGLVRQSDSRLVLTSWEGAIYQVDLAQGEKAKVTLLQDVRGKHNTADIGISRDGKVLYVPQFFAQSVTAYRLAE